MPKIGFSFNKIFVYIFLSLVAFSLPALAAGNLTATGSDLAPTYINTKTVTNMLNLSLNATPDAGDGTVNITVINVTIGGNATIGNLSSVHIKNSTGSIIASNTTNSTSSQFKVHISNGLFVNASTNSSIVIAINLSSSAQRVSNISINISSTTDIGTAGSSNITISNTNSTESQIQDIHANVTVSPRYVDTNVINQSLSYFINTSGADAIKNVSIVVPSQYSIVQLLSVKRGSTILTGITDYTNTTTGGKVNISLVSSTTENLTINFTVNTNASGISSQAFNSTITGSNLTDVETDVYNFTTNVTTKQLINVDNIQVIKNTALANGTDYWEFNFTLNITANVSGLVQFKMNNWNNSAGQIMNLTNQTSLINATFYASLRHSSNTTNTFNVTNEYRNVGLSFTATENTLYYFVLRMVIPSGTPIASDWWTTYWTLFRSTPS